MRGIKPLIVSVRNISHRKWKEKESAVYLYILFDCLEWFVIHSAVYHKIRCPANGHQY